MERRGVSAVFVMHAPTESFGKIARRAGVAPMESWRRFVRSVAHVHMARRRDYVCRASAAHTGNSSIIVVCAIPALTES